MKLIVWLGNPGKEYKKTRHNIGFVMIDDFLKNEHIEVWKHGTMGGDILETVIENQKIVFLKPMEFMNRGDILETVIENQKIVFLKPMEFMNRSWWVVSAIANFYKIDAQDILVIHDDIDLPVGKIQLKLWWSSAGHNWLKNIIEQIWTKDFWRLRIGIDRPTNKSDVADYVLDIFSAHESSQLLQQSSQIFDILFHRLHNEQK